MKTTQEPFRFSIGNVSAGFAPEHPISIERYEEEIRRAVYTVMQSTVLAYRTPSTPWVFSKGKESQFWNELMGRA